MTPAGAAAGRMRSASKRAAVFFNRCMRIALLHTHHKRKRVVLGSVSWAGQRAIGWAVGEYDHEQFTKQLADARIGGTAGRGPCRGLRQRQLVAAVYGVDVEGARTSRSQARHAAAD